MVTRSQSVQLSLIIKHFHVSGITVREITVIKAEGDENMNYFFQFVTIKSTLNHT